MPLYNLTNSAIRGFGLFVRFFFVFVLVYYLDENDVGYYGVLTSLVGYVALFLAFELHNFTTKQIIISDENISNVIVTSIFSVFVFSLMSIPIVHVATYFKLVNNRDIILVALILVFEMLSMDIARILNALSMQLSSTAVNFLRSAFWCIIFLIAAYTGMITASITNLLLTWLLGSIISFLVGVFVILYAVELKKEHLYINYKWIVRGLKNSAPMIPVALVYQIFFTLDRLIVSNNPNPVLVSSYVIYAISSTSILGLLDAGVFVYYLPNLIKLSTSGTKEEFSELMYRMCKAVVTAVLIIYPIIGIMIYLLLELINKSSYLEFFILYCILSIGYGLFAISSVFHIGLFSLNKEKSIMKLQTIQLPFFIISCFCFFELMPNYGISLAILLNFLMLMITKFRAYRVAFSLHNFGAHRAKSNYSV